jgi:hypothetical protein
MESPPIPKCTKCKQAMSSLKPLPVRIGAMTGPWRMVLGALADGSETVNIDLYRCDQCGRLELYDHGFVLPAAEPKDSS